MYVFCVKYNKMDEWYSKKKKRRLMHDFFCAIFDNRILKSVNQVHGEWEVPLDGFCE